MRMLNNKKIIALSSFIFPLDLLLLLSHCGLHLQRLHSREMSGGGGGHVSPFASSFHTVVYAMCARYAITF